MKKRLLLILAIGISFVPAAFADFSDGYNYTAKRLGQQPLSRTTHTAIACDAAKQDKSLPSSNEAPDRSREATSTK